MVQAGEGESRTEGAGRGQQMLAAKAEILAYFGLSITSEGRLEAIPDLLGGYQPDVIRLPAVVLALANDIDWDADARSLIWSLAEVCANSARDQCTCYGQSTSCR